MDSKEFEELRQNLDSKGFTPEQERQIILGRENGVDTETYEHLEYTCHKMFIIRVALENDIDISDYVKPEFKCETVLEFTDAMKQLQTEIVKKTRSTNEEEKISLAKRCVKSLMFFTILGIASRLCLSGDSLSMTGTIVSIGSVETVILTGIKFCRCCMKNIVRIQL